jgi:fucose permease
VTRPAAGIARRADGERRPGPLLLVIAFTAFASLGLPDGALGVAWPSICRAFGLPLSRLGVLLAAAMIGYLASSFASGWLVTRLGVGPLLLWSSVLMTLSSLGFALAPAWPVVVVSGTLAGLGAGAVDAGINAFAAARLPPRLVSWLHAAYGAGAMLGPVLITGVLTAGLSWRWGYGALGGLLGAMALCFAVTRGSWRTGEPRAGDPAAAAGGPGPPVARGLETLRRPAVWLNIALFFVYTGLEATAGQWTYTLFTESRGVPPALAGASVAGYWGGMTAGRLAAGALTRRFPAATLLGAATLGAPAAAVLVSLDAGWLVGGLGLALVGVLLGPIYPLLISGTPRRLGTRYATHAIGFQVAAAYLGAAAIPGLAGVLAHAIGLEVIGPFIAVVALALRLLYGHSARTGAGGSRRADDAER